MGQFVADEFSVASQPYVVVERNDARMEDFNRPFGHYLEGDATLDEVLIRAGIERAKAVVVALPSDADNVLVTMTARLLNDKIPIVSRLENLQTEPKLRRAGATKVVAPASIGGFRVAQAVLRPAVLDFIEVATGSQHLDLTIEEVTIGQNAPLSGRSIEGCLEGCRVGDDQGAMVVAVLSPTGDMTFNPDASLQVAAGDTLIAIGHPGALKTISKGAEAPGT